MEYPVIRGRPDKGQRPERQRCAPGQVLLFCPFDRLYLPFGVAPDDGRRVCSGCGFRIADHEMVDVEAIRHLC